MGVGDTGRTRMNTLEKMQRWYAVQCNGDWEHHRGISIESCDNPGWWVKIDLKGTDLEKLSFTEIGRNVSSDRHPTSDDWMDCYVEGCIWNGSGDASKLQAILEVFLAWAGCGD